MEEREKDIKAYLIPNEDKIDPTTQLPQELFLVIMENDKVKLLLPLSSKEVFAIIRFIKYVFSERIDEDKEKTKKDETSKKK